MRRLVLNYLILVVIGMMMIYSSTYKLLLVDGKFPFNYVLRQFIVLVAIAIIAYIVLYNRKFFNKLLKKSINFIFFLVLISLFLVLTPLGIYLGGAKSAISLGIVNFQPIELAKLTLIFYMAKILSENPNLQTKEYIQKVFIFPFMYVLLVFLEPDLGGAIILVLLIFALIFLNGRNFEIIISIIFISILASVVLILLLPYISAIGNYQIDRLQAWINPFDPSVIGNSGQNLIQGYIAISNGGVLGSGFLNSAQNSGYLFASSSDFIFTIIAEEWGMIGVLVVIGSLLTLAYQMFIIGIKSKKKFEYLACSGIAALILIQTFVNLGGVTGLIPMTGVTLPFISKGVNSFIFLSFGVLYVLIVASENEYEKRKKEKQEQKEMFYE